MKKFYQLSEHVTARPLKIAKNAVTRTGEPAWPKDAPEYIGLIIDHLTPDGNPCNGVIHWYRHPDVEGPLWTLISEDPLTIDPSIQCQCGAHGFIIEGEWRRA
jgi:hypothetical protein